MSIISAQAAEKGDTYDRQGFTEKGTSHQIDTYFIVNEIINGKEKFQTAPLSLLRTAIPSLLTAQQQAREWGIIFPLKKI